MSFRLYAALELPPEHYLQLRLEYIGFEEFDFHTRAWRIQRDAPTALSSSSRPHLVPRSPLYLLCPTRMSVRELKRFLALRFELDLLPLASARLPFPHFPRLAPKNMPRHAPSSPKQQQQNSTLASCQLSPPLDAAASIHQQLEAVAAPTLRTPSPSRSSTASPSPSTLLTPNAAGVPVIDEEESDEPLAAVLSRIVLYSGHAVIPEEHTLADVASSTSGSAGGAVPLSPPRRSALHGPPDQRSVRGSRSGSHSDSFSEDPSTTITLFFTMFL